MKKVGIITYYSAINEGAFLQAYCLSNFLKSEFDTEVVFVRNTERNCREIEQLKSLLKGHNPKQIISNISRYRAMKKAQMDNFTIESRSSVFDLIVVGSDEMWNVSNKMYSVYNLGIGYKANQFISYAVSMGQYEDALPKDAIERIADFSLLSVRDNNSVTVLKQAGFKDIKIHLDPVFLYDIEAVEPLKKLPRFLLVYGLITNQSEISAIEKFANNHGLTIISLDIFNKWCHNIVAHSPFEFIGYIDKAEYIVTNMFHGTMLSAVRNKKFVSILTKRRKNKVLYAAELLGFTNRCLKNPEEVIAKLNCILPAEINYSLINRCIENEKKRTIEYFERGGLVRKRVVKDI